MHPNRGCYPPTVPSYQPRPQTRFPPPLGPVPVRDISPSVVRLRGLPYSANEMDVAQFLNGVDVMQRGIHLMYAADEKPLGECFVELCSDKDVEEALTRHRLSIGHRYVEVFRSSGEELRSIIESAEKLAPPLADSVELSPFLPLLFQLAADYPYKHKFRWTLQRH
eukprot:Sspe_Gene.58634::Locus_32166_Transcript_7_11_Confidence_0.068_Length_821::g.58634::m.58634/K12898/HNRNPF_H; heterogeneous nuclear ribonucleoprotein F/H